MSRENRVSRVVVTGLGLVTSIGIGKEGFWTGALEGRSGGTLLDFHWTDQRFSTRVGAPVRGFDPGDFEISQREADLLDKVSQYAIAGALMALRDAGHRVTRGEGKRSTYEVESVDSRRLSVILGTGIGGLTTTESSHRSWIIAPNKPLKRYHLPMLIPNAPAAQVAIRFGARGECKAVTTACASGTMAMGDAFRAIQLGEADVVITGGTEGLMPDHDGWGMKGFDLLRAMSTRNDDPKKASRPFDRERDGFVMSEGAGVLVLEREEFARDRGAEVYAEVLGYETNCDAYHIVMLEPEGRQIVNLMSDLLRKTGVSPSEVHYINAHGTSTPANDRTETASIRSVFGGHADDLFVSSTKSMTGHAIGASGGIEAAATALSVRTGRIPPTINYEYPDPECDLNYVPNRYVERRIEIALSNSYGFGGHNASVMLGRY